MPLYNTIALLCVFWDLLGHSLTIISVPRLEGLQFSILILNETSQQMDEIISTLFFHLPLAQGQQGFRTQLNATSFYSLSEMVPTYILLEGWCISKVVKEYKKLQNL